MGARLPSVVSTTPLGSPILTTTETVVCTTPPISPSFENQVILIFWNMVIQIGGGTTFLQGKIRRGTTVAGTQVNGNNANPATAGLNCALCGCFFDIPGVIAGLQYSLTAICGTATGNSNVTEVCMIAMAL